MYPYDVIELIQKYETERIREGGDSLKKALQKLFDQPNGCEGKANVLDNIIQFICI